MKENYTATIWSLYGDDNSMLNGHDTATFFWENSTLGFASIQLDTV